MPKRCAFDGCSKWVTAGETLCLQHAKEAGDAEKAKGEPTTKTRKKAATYTVGSSSVPPAASNRARPKTHIEKQRATLGLNQKNVPVGMKEGSLGHFMGAALGIEHRGKSRGLVKATFHNKEAADYHSNKGANKEMAKAFAAMVMATKDQSGNVKLPSKLVKEAKEKKTRKECAVSECTKPIVKKGYCAEHSNEFRLPSTKKESSSVSSASSSSSSQASTSSSNSSRPSSSSSSDSTSSSTAHTIEQEEDTDVPAVDITKGTEEKEEGSNESEEDEWEVIKKKDSQPASTTKQEKEKTKDSSGDDQGAAPDKTDSDLSRDSSSAAESCFPVETLQNQRESLPSSVDQSHLEDYLSDFDFAAIFGMAREDLAAMRAWKRNKLKKDNGLF